MYAFGLNPNSLAFASLIIRQADAPSVYIKIIEFFSKIHDHHTQWQLKLFSVLTKNDEFAAVTVPYGLTNAGFNLAN